MYHIIILNLRNYNTNSILYNNYDKVQNGDDKVQNGDCVTYTI